MYPNLRAEMARFRMSMSQLAEILGITGSTMSLKCAGKTSFTLDEAMAVKKALHTDLCLEKLFEKEELK